MSKIEVDDVGRLKPYPIRVTTQSDQDLFFRKISNPEDESIVLSEKQQEKLDRMYVCKELIDKRISRTKVIPKLMNQCNISQAQAYKIYADTIAVFDQVSESKGRDIWVDILLGNIMETRNKALAKDDLKVVSMCDKLFKETIAEFFGGAEAQKYRDIQPPNISFVYSPDQLGIEDQKDLDQEIKKLKESRVRNNQVFETTEILKPESSNGDREE